MNLDGLLAGSDIAMLLADDTGHYVDVNEAACALLGLTREELLAGDVAAVTPVALRGRVPEMWQRFLALGSMQGVYELADASGAPVRITYMAVANVAPGLHLSMLLTSWPASEAGVLSAREREVVGLAATGLTSSEIAAALSLARATVESHFRSAVRRLGARNRAHAIALALTRGEITLPAEP
jgi:DNA-binding CsgD family transcriptional regulator